jgi:hypothetical protein
MLSFADVMHFLADEFSRLRAGRLALTFCRACALDGSSLWHDTLPPNQRSPDSIGRQWGLGRNESS